MDWNFTGLTCHRVQCGSRVYPQKLFSQQGLKDPYSFHLVTTPSRILGFQDRSESLFSCALLWINLVTVVLIPWCIKEYCSYWGIPQGREWSSHLISSYSLPGTALSALWTLSHFSLTITLFGSYYQLFYKWGHGGSEMLSNVPNGAVCTNPRTGFWTHIYLIPKLVLLPTYPAALLLSQPQEPTIFRTGLWTELVEERKED